MDLFLVDIQTLTRSLTPSDEEDLFSSNATTTSSMDLWERSTLRNRYSKPFPVEEWKLLRYCPKDGKWNGVISMPASGPLINADFIGAIFELFRRIHLDKVKTNNSGSLYRMYLHKNVIRSGVDCQGYREMQDARLTVLTITLHAQELRAHNMDGAIYWRKKLKSIYTSKDLLDDLCTDLSIRRARILPQQIGTFAQVGVIIPNDFRSSIDVLEPVGS